MNYLLSGGFNPKVLDLLLQLTNIKSDDVKAALHDHLCRGMSRELAASVNYVDKSNFNRAYRTLNEKAKTVELIKEEQMRNKRQS